MRQKKVEPKHAFHINLSASLYQKVLNKVGRGNVSPFIKRLLEKELGNSEEQLKQQLIKGYQSRAENKDLQKTLRTYGENSWEDVSIELDRREKRNGKK
jgi:hypothetical protein